MPRYMSHEAADVAAKTLEDEQLLTTVRALIVAVANSPEAIQSVTALTGNVRESLAWPRAPLAPCSLNIDLVCETVRKNPLLSS